jgi:hypothetical protein
MHIYICIYIRIYRAVLCRSGEALDLSIDRKASDPGDRLLAAIFYKIQLYFSVDPNKDQHPA